MTEKIRENWNVAKQFLCWWHLFYASVALINIAAFFAAGDWDDLVIAALFITIGIWHWVGNAYETIIELLEEELRA